MPEQALGGQHLLNINYSPARSPSQSLFIFLFSSWFMVFGGRFLFS